MELTDQERKEIADALKRESARLRTNLTEYNRVKANTKNTAVKAMAEEGATNVNERVPNLDRLAAKVLGTSTQGTQR